MTPLELSKSSDPDVRSSFAALQRAAALARKEAIATDTDIVVVKDGQLLIIEAKTLREQANQQAANGNAATP